MKQIHEFEFLANAIIEQAVKDWRSTYGVEYTTFNCNLKSSESIRREIKQFFFSDWFKVLTNVDPHAIYDRLVEEYMETLDG